LQKFATVYWQNGMISWVDEHFGSYRWISPWVKSR